MMKGTTYVVFSLEFGNGLVGREDWELWGLTHDFDRGRL